jgi:DNA-binding transcriptional ArsR family regulator
MMTRLLHTSGAERSPLLRLTIMSGDPAFESIRSTLSRYLKRPRLLCLLSIERLASVQNSCVSRCRGFGSSMNPTDELHAVQIARALCDHTRFLIYTHIADVNEMRCQDICLGTPVRASTVSHHLRVLSKSGLIESRREGQAVYYRTVPDRLRSYLKFLRTLERKEQELRKISTVAAQVRAISSK